MLVKQGSISKCAFLGTLANGAVSLLGKGLSTAAGGIIKAPFKGAWGAAKYAWANPGKAIGIGGVGLTDYNLAKDGVSAMSAAAATPYRYF